MIDVYGKHCRKGISPGWGLRKSGFPKPLVLAVRYCRQGQGQQAVRRKSGTERSCRNFLREPGRHLC
jgi:hypothetical protein